MEKLPGAQGPYKEPAAMACLPSLAFVAFAACFEAPSSSSLRSPPSIASGASCHPFPCSPPVDLSLELCGSRFGAAFRISGSFALPAPSPACCFGAIWWSPPFCVFPSFADLAWFTWKYVLGGRVSTTFCVAALRSVHDGV